MIKKWLEKNRPLAYSICGAALLLAMIVFFSTMSRSGGPPDSVVLAPLKVYYYNPSADGLFAASVQDVPPIPIPPKGENQGFRAYVYSCGQCDKPEGRATAYIEKFSPEARKILIDAKNDPDARLPKIMEQIDAMEGGHLISRAIPVPAWKPITDEESVQLIAEFNTTCENGLAADDCKPAQ